MLQSVIEERNIPLEANEREVLFSLVDTVFFASLMREEGEPVRIAVVHDDGGAEGLAKALDASPENDEDPARAWDVTGIARRPFEASSLAKLARGLEYGVQLVVVGGTQAGDLWIDGIARRVERTDGGDAMRIAAPRPGVLVFEHQMTEVLRFEAGQQVPPTIDVLGADGLVRDAVGKITGDGGGGEGYSFTESALRRLIRRMRATGSGALLAMLPIRPSEEVLSEVRYRRVDTKLLKNRIDEDKKRRFASLLAGLSDPERGVVSTATVRQRRRKHDEADQAETALDEAVDDLGRLSAIDGAVLAGPGLEVYGAGCVISVGEVGEIVHALDANGNRTEPYSRPHGARHKAAFSFAWTTPGAVAFVVSEDGPVSCALRVADKVLVWSVRVSET